MNIGKSVKRLQFESDTSNIDLANSIGITQVHISRIRTHSICSDDLKKKLAKHFGLKVSEFIALGE